MSRATVGEALIARLADWGVDTVFGLPGDGVNGIMEGLRRNADRVRFVLVHHEEAAAFMAVAHAKATGRLGVCLATSGPGGIHLANGLYDAKLDHAPVLAITGMQESSVIGTAYQQEVHLDRLFEDVAEYNETIGNPAQVPSLVDIAVRTALARRGVAHLTVPNDVQVATAGDNPFETVGPTRAPATAPVLVAPPVRPADDDLQAAADLLNNASKPAILAGIGARGAGPLVELVADVLGAPIVKSLLGKMVVPDDSPFALGGLGLLGTAPSEDLMQECDALLMVGTNFPYTKFLPAPGQAHVVQIDVEPARVGTRIPTDVPLVGDAAATCEALLPRLRRRTDRRWLLRYQEKMRDWRERMAATERADRDPIAPQFLASTLDRVAAPDAILACDSGTVTTWAARHWQATGGREFYLSGTLASMAPGLPYAIALQHEYPNRQVIAFVGDGGFAMLMAEFHTAARYKLPIKVVINDNSALGMIVWEQMVNGFPEFGVRYGDDPQADYVAWARGCGAYAARVTDPIALENVLGEAFAFDGPALVDVAVDADEPPMPASVTYQQAAKFAEAFVRGQPRKAAIATTLLKDRITRL
ncbi:thiamine pyrophosphate-dependent enzyme [Dactylosporangium sp. NPDC050588]|uniref:thiamine pyrophosphate-dependent enzyme n=1 Tax=Dactylosporangium sp. NPDC050588 TaxID=3157211 RepID=UPI003404CC97